MEEHTKKAKSAWENGKLREANDLDDEKRKVNGKASAITSDTLPKPSKQSREDTEGEVSLRSFLRASPFLSAEVEEEDNEVIIRPPLKSLQREWQNGDEAFNPKSKVTPSAQKLFEKWQNAACAQVGKADLDAMVREMYLSGKLDKSEANAASAIGKRESAGEFKDLSSEMSFRIRKSDKSPFFECSDPPLRQSSEKERFMVRGEPLMPSRKQEPKCNVRMDFLREDPIR